MITPLTMLPGIWTAKSPLSKTEEVSGIIWTSLLYFGSVRKNA